MAMLVYQSVSFFDTCLFSHFDTPEVQHASPNEKGGPLKGRSGDPG